MLILSVLLGVAIRQASEDRMDEDIAYARWLIQAGIPTELHVYAGAYHGFDGLAPGAAVSRRCNAACNEALRRAFGG